MSYLIGFHLGWLLCALAIGGIVGWVTWEKSPAHWVDKIVWIAIVVLGLALLVAIFKLVPDRPGYWLDLALLMVWFYGMGCGLGWVLRDLAFTEPDTVGMARPPYLSKPGKIPWAGGGAATVFARDRVPTGTSDAVPDVPAPGATSGTDAVPDVASAPAPTPVASLPTAPETPAPAAPLPAPAAPLPAAGVAPVAIEPTAVPEPILVAQAPTNAPLQATPPLEPIAAPPSRPAPPETILATQAPVDVAPTEATPAPVPVIPAVVLAPVADAPSHSTELAPPATIIAAQAPVEGRPPGPALAPAVPDQDKHAGTRPVGLVDPRGGIADDLKRIKGIGKQNEGRLHGLGIWHFDQIAAWTPDHALWVGSYLAFPGRIQREKWIEQAAVLATGQETDFSKRAEAGLVASSKDDGSLGQSNAVASPKPAARPRPKR